MPWEPIIPKKKKIINEAAASAACYTRMARLCVDAWRALANYEAPASLHLTGKTHLKWSVNKKTGKKYKSRVKSYTGYKRTGTLKKSWSYRVGYGLFSGALVGEVRSSGMVAPYNVYVRDDKLQTKVMESKGWLKAKVIWEPLWKQARADFTYILYKPK